MNPPRTLFDKIWAKHVVGPDGFEIDATRRERLLKGLDDVGITLQHMAEIEAFETRQRAGLTWLPRIE